MGESKHAVQGQRQLDGAEIGPEMPTGFGDRLNDEVADLAGQLVELGVAQSPQIGGLPDLVQGHVGHERYPSSCSRLVFGSDQLARPGDRRRGVVSTAEVEGDS